MEEPEARRLRRRRKLLRVRMEGIEEFVRGSVVLMKRRCGRRGCRRCASGEGHPTWVLTWSERGKTRTAYLGVGRAEAARRLSENYRRLMGLVEQVSDASRALLTGRTYERKGSLDEEGPWRAQGP